MKRPGGTFEGTGPKEGPRLSGAAQLEALSKELGRARRARARAEAMLELAEAKYRALAEHVPGIVYMAAIGDYGDARYVSPQIERLLGVPPGEWVANPSLWIDHVHPADRRRVLTQMVKGQHRKGPISLEYRMVSRDGTVRWFRDTATVLEDRAGRPCLLHGVMLELTLTSEEVQRLQSIIERQDALLAYSMSSTAILALDGTIRFESRAEDALLGYARGELDGKNVFDLVHPDELPAAIELFSRAVADPAQRVEMVCRARHKDGSWVTLRCMAKNLAHRPEIGGVVLSCIPVEDRS